MRITGIMFRHRCDGMLAPAPYASMSKHLGTGVGLWAISQDEGLVRTPWRCTWHTKGLSVCRPRYGESNM